MGYALAHAALKAGAEVTLVSGPVSLTAPINAKVINVETAAQMHKAVMENVANHDIYIGAAAVADYSPVVMQQEKIKKTADLTTITLSKTKDILADVALLDNPPYTVGFAAETHNLERYAKNKLTQKKLDMIAANWVGREESGFDSDQNALEVFWNGGQKSLKMADKNQIATELIDLIVARLPAKRNSF
jgi:phosphopantothenoylcysteine decarboxylase/phosphopantothenate--cysteine ligase